MKKYSYFILCILFSFFVVSCSDDEGDPSQVGITEQATIPDDKILAPGTSQVRIALLLTADSRDLRTLVVKKDGTEIRNFTDLSKDAGEITDGVAGADNDVFNKVSNRNMTYIMNDPIDTSTLEDEDVVTFTFELSDGENSNTFEVKFTYDAEATAGTPFDTEADLAIERQGGADATGLDMFGLAWTENSAGFMAIIKKDGADRFVELPAASWDNIVTKETLQIAVDNAQDMDEFSDISVSEEGTYQIVLATLYNEEYYMIYITDTEIEVDEQVGTIVKINGSFKK